MPLSGRMRIPILSVEFKSQNSLLQFINALCDFQNELFISLSKRGNLEVLAISNGSDLVEIDLNPVCSDYESRPATIYIIDVLKGRIHRDLLETIKNNKEISLLHSWETPWRL